MLKALMLALLLSGCGTLRATVTATDVGGVVADEAGATIYTRPEIDAINARIQCRNMARTMIQISRCEAR
jgi:predicted lipoprotein with Yx(FWY)xxD motif